MTLDKNWVMSTFHKKILKVFHIIFAASMFGGLVSILTILIVKENYNMVENVFIVDLGILKIFTWGVNYAFFALMLTSLAFGMFTEWGFVKYCWIIFKWVVVLIMFAVTWFGLGPAINGMTSIVDAGLNNSTLSREYLNFQQKAIVLTVIEGVSILLIILISVIKPWGVRNIHIENVDLTKVIDGIYQGEAKVGNYTYKVKAK